jgi:hypothetical protein
MIYDRIQVQAGVYSHLRSLESGRFDQERRENAVPTVAGRTPEYGYLIDSLVSAGLAE